MSERLPTKKRAVTQKYDMKQLHALQEMEEKFIADLCLIYSCEEDDLPVVVDCVEIFNEPQARRQAHMQELLKDAPGDCSAIIAEVVAKMDELHH
jgi:hypothetical protein